MQIVPAGGREPIQIVSRAHGQPDLPQRFAIALLAKINHLMTASPQGHTIHAACQEATGWQWQVQTL
ncbi:hypothetical protein [Streptosporangium sp. NPDC020145]|uniref:hypothetical protein n=1 Tax=Streptosporangium sp. NPDC020145 TaxID=3154694 RepID=UPI00342962BF